MGILKKFLNLVDLSRPQSILFVFGSGLFILAISPYHWIENSFFKCIWKTYVFPFFFNGHCPSTGILANCNCPGCGMTRAIWQILHGNFKEAYNLNHLSPLVFIILLSFLFINIYKFYKQNN